MRNILLLTFCLFIATRLFAQTSIYSIQFTTVAGTGNTYPSTKVNQSVTTGGIVTANNYLGGRFYIASSKGGAWNGIFVYDNKYSPNIGDSILISGTVIEYNGYTEISNLSSYQVKSVSNPLPAATKISTANVRSEAYEGVLVEINNCTASSVFDQYGNCSVDDGTGACDIRPGIYNLKNDNFPLLLNYPFSSITGVIGINSGSISLQPRSVNDFVSSTGKYIFYTEAKTVKNDLEFELPIQISILNNLAAIGSYSIKMQYDPNAFAFTGYAKSGTISEAGTVTDVSGSGNIVLNFSGNTSCPNFATLIKLKFTPVITGNANLRFNQPVINGSEILFYSAGKLEYTSTNCSIPIGDTLTIVQRPLLNIPSIVIPGEVFTITCFAPQNTTNWSAELFYNDVKVPLSITQSAYDTDLQKWMLTAVIPNVDLYELYNLRVTASGGITDDVANAVKVIDKYQDSYYFVQITDTHLPTHLFYADAGSDTDESGLTDLYEVIKDINLIRPEFVLLTGDLINEGELEDFECRRNHTRSIEMLRKLEVPVYLVPGNHDLGGWDATPPPQGTSRREWWRFFGWRQLQIPPVRKEYYTHDYSFNYGNIHFTGLEAYDNYDSYMYSVYGATSFIPSQLTWLQNDLAAAGTKKKVLFYHYDFKSELNLTNLGVDMALWGHIHSDAGSITTTPYNLATAAVCDGRRAFRVIRVNNGTLQPENTVRASSNGDMLTLAFNMINNGSLDSVSATIINKYSQSFSNGLVKFVMPLSNSGYSATNGTLEQVYKTATNATCYVRVNIAPGGTITSSVKRLTPLTDIAEITENKNTMFFPNPFSVETKMNFKLNSGSNVTVSVYNMAGQLVKTIANGTMSPGNHSVTWDGTNETGNSVGNGVYIYQLKAGAEIIGSGQIVFKR